MGKGKEKTALESPLMRFFVTPTGPVVLNPLQLQEKLLSLYINELRARFFAHGF